MGRISTSPKYLTDITGSDPLSLEELGEGNSEKLEKNELFVAYEWVFRS